MNFAFGLIADTQYVNADDGTTFDGMSVRRYRQSLETLKKACFSYVELSHNRNLVCCVQLGDVIDEKSKKLGISDKSIDEVIEVCKSTGLQWHYCIGNHDLICFSREYLSSKLIPNDSLGKCSTKLYYDFIPSPSCRFIFLDGYDISSISSSTPQNNEYATQL